MAHVACIFLADRNEPQLRLDPENLSYFSFNMRDVINNVGKVCSVEN